MRTCGASMQKGVLNHDTGTYPFVMLKMVRKGNTRDDCPANPKECAMASEYENNRIACAASAV